MKIADIRKLNNEVVKNCEEFVFLKKLYEHSLKVIDKVPKSFVNDVLEEANRLKMRMETVHVGKEFQEETKTSVTYVSFTGYSVEDDFIRSFKVNNFDLFGDYGVVFEFDDENAVSFYLSDEIFSVENIKRIFGKELLEVDHLMCRVSVKCFE